MDGIHIVYDLYVFAVFKSNLWAELQQTKTVIVFEGGFYLHK